MAGLASGAIYLASSLATGGPSVATQPSPVLAAPAEAASEQQRGPRPYVIVDLPRLSSPAAGMGEAVALEVRRDADPRLRSDPPAASDPEDPVALDVAVVAEHAARIAALEQHIAALRRDNAAGPVLAGLMGKLRRAEAARNLATARVALAGGSPARCATGCAAPPVQIAAARVAGSQRPDPGRSPIDAAASKAPALPRKAAPSVTPMRSAAPAPRAAAQRAASEIAAPLSRQAARSAARDTHASADRATANELARARRLLAAARAALEGEPQADERPLHLAGLWTWEGSDRWSLAPTSRTA